MAFIAPDLGIDLGTTNTRLFVKKKGILIDEPTLVLIDGTKRRVTRSYGDEAFAMLGRTTENVRAVRPVRGENISDFDNAGFMLKHFIRKAIGNSHVFSSRAVMTLPCHLSLADRENLTEIAEDAGIRTKQLSLISKPFAAALGAQLPVFDPVGSMVVDIGGGTTEAAVISLGGVVASQSTRVAGERMNESIVNYIKRKHSADISLQAAEDIKFALGTALPVREERRVEVRSRDMINNLPQDIVVTSTDIFKALQPPCEAILVLIQNILDRTPPELCGDILRGGITLTGGGAKLFALREFISSALQLPVYVAREPLDAAINGVGQLTEQPELLDKVSKTGFLEQKGD